MGIIERRKHFWFGTFAVAPLLTPTTLAMEFVVDDRAPVSLSRLTSGGRVRLPMKRAGLKASLGIGEMELGGNNVGVDLYGYALDVEPLDAF